jgi:uncharacterized membrane protein YjfL (UPF0719 family)
MEAPMGLLELFLLICVIGVVVYLIRRFVPMDQSFKDFILWAGIGVVVLILLAAFGVLDALRGVRVPHV